jgi:Zn-dependent peptidase ImmA (M78 family)
MHRFPTPDMEHEADEFASCFLAPTSDIRPFFEGRKVDLRLLAALKPEWKMSMGSLIFAAERCGAVTEGQKTWLWKQFAMNGYRLREPSELDFPQEEPRTLNDLIALHMNDMGYSLADLATVMNAREGEFARTYSIEISGEAPTKPTRLRIVK